MTKSSRWKKTAALAAAAGMLLSCAGCGKEKKTVTYDLDGEIPESMTIFCNLGSKPQAAGAQNFNEVMSFKLMEELTGCKVEWIHPPSTAIGEKFNLMVASGEYPDAIVYDWSAAAGGVTSFVDDEVIISLTDIIEDAMPNYISYLNENPEIKKQCINDDGDFITVPFIRKDKELNIYLGPQIRTDWLEKLGLDVPKTTDDFYKVLKAFKTGDPNGNGKADEIPMSGIAFDNSGFGIGNLMWAFGTTYDFCLKDGKVTYGPVEKEFKEGLSYITKLYKEGLIDRDYLLNDNQRLKKKVITDQVGFVFAFQPTGYYDAMYDGKREVLGIEHLTGPDGKKHCYQSAYTSSVLGTSFAVTSSNKNPVGTLKWLDNFYGEKGIEYMNFGEEGTSFEWEDGYPRFTDYIYNNKNGKSYSDMFGLTIGAVDSAFPTLQDYRYYEQMISDWGKRSIEVWSNDDADTSNILPALQFTNDEEKVVSDILVQVDAVAKEAMNKIVIGQSSIDDWDKTVEKMKKLGIDDVIKIYNDAYKRYKNR